MSPSELSEFRARCLKAKSNGHRVANASIYAALLEAEGGEIALRRGMPKHSAAHLVALADNVAKVRAEEGKKAPTKKAATKKAAKPKKAAKSKKAAPAEPVEEPVMEPEAAPVEMEEAAAEKKEDDSE